MLEGWWLFGEFLEAGELLLGEAFGVPAKQARGAVGVDAGEGLVVGVVEVPGQHGGT